MKTTKTVLPIFFLYFVLFLFQTVNGQGATTPGEVEWYQTLNSIGIEWSISGDDNHNAECEVKYKQNGESEWQDALPLYRIDFNDANMMAGSILFLEPSTSYEIKLTLTDSDGGNSSESLEVTTRGTPQIPTGGNTYYVVPGNGGGSGTTSDPFLGIVEAQISAQPGDVFLLQTGNYASNEDNGKIQFTVSGESENYIVWKADEGATPVLSGARIDCNFIWLEGVTIQNQENGILVGTGQPEGIVITRNHFKGCYNSIYINHGGKNWYITDNVIEGNIPDFTTGEFGGEGVELWHSDGCVVAYNKIFNTADGVSYPGKNCDIFRNEIYNVSDDGIEFDYGYANNRAWENRITNANNNGISFQPMNGSPMYVIRNQVYVHGKSALKLRDAVDRALIAHNTFVCWKGVEASGSNLLVSFQSNNNLWISVTNRYVWEDGNSSTITDWRTNLDYDGFDWNDNSLAFKWSGERLETLEDFKTFSGLEENSIRVRKNEIFENYSFPEIPSPAPLQYLTLKNGCNAVDAGVPLNNINDGYNGSAPDLGAFEYGSELPVYGPRYDVVTDIEPVAKRKLWFNSHPNPFKESTVINYQLESKGYIQLELFDLAGRKIATLVDEEKPAGSYQYTLIANEFDLSDNVYFVRLIGKDQIESLSIIYSE